mmetsp:Transcript_109103/g.319310  ORF Transcript_109103/g.319310 Transcript_109103/m.319310 type:complete len:118 (+) Transcript_109103:1365-1718(+)
MCTYNSSGPIAGSNADAGPGPTIGTLSRPQRFKWVATTNGARATADAGACRSYESALAYTGGRVLFNKPAGSSTRVGTCAGFSGRADTRSGDNATARSSTEGHAEPNGRTYANAWAT